MHIIVNSTKKDKNTHIQEEFVMIVLFLIQD